VVLLPLKEPWKKPWKALAPVVPAVDPLVLLVVLVVPVFVVPSSSCGVSPAQPITTRAATIARSDS
jgi:hypothetical protein